MGLTIEYPNHILEFISLIPTDESKKKSELLNAIELISEFNLLDNNHKRRDLASFQSYFKFNELLNIFWNSIITSEERLFFYPLYLWWSITAIIPLRPREFLLTPRDCISKIENKYYLTLRRNKLKGSSGKVHYNITLDYIEVKYEIPITLYELIIKYIELTDIYENNIIKTLFRAEPHYAMFNMKKNIKSRFYTYVNLSTSLKLFYQNIIRDRFNINVLKSTQNISIDYNDNNIEYIYLGDTRHIALINIITEGGTPTLAMQLAGHSDIDMSSHYYTNISNMIECKTYMKYKKMIKGNEDFAFGLNYYNSNLESNYVGLENNGRCYSPKFFVNDMSDCKNVMGNNGEIGYCPNCTYYRINNMNYFLKEDDIYKTKIENDCKYLNYVLKKYRKGQGYIEDIKEAVMKLESSSSQYKNYYVKKLLFRKGDETDG